MYPNKQITTNAFNDTIAMKWLLGFPVSDLLRAIPVIKEKKHKHGLLIMTEDKHDEASPQADRFSVSAILSKAGS